MTVNCWEAMGCGREQGGKKARELGVCPAATCTRLDGIHRGRNAGRACWAVAGTLCGGRVQGTFATKLVNCLNCDFYQRVLSEEAGDFLLSSQILKRFAK